MADTAALKKQRASNKGRLTNIINFISTANDDTPVEEFKTRLARVEQLMTEFTSIESKIFSISPHEESDFQYEENYYTAVTGLNTWIRSKVHAAGNRSPDISFNVTNNGTHHEIKLPKIHIPPFAGDYREWQSFYDLFCSTIHESASLSPVQKFQYLIGFLRGEAAVLLRHISITEGNYIGALNKLKARYDRKRHIINAFLRTFIEQPSISSATTASVKRLMDTSDEVIRGLKALGENAETRDHWLIFLLVQKLDDKSKALWAEYTADLENPQFSNFMDFLSRRIDTLETTSMSIRKPIAPSKIKSHVSAEAPTYTCAICDEADHSFFSCQKFNQMDVDQRKNWSKTNNRCFNCLSRNHLIEKCPSRRRCQLCYRKHHTLLHTQDNQQPDPTSNSPSNTNEETLAVHCAPNAAKSTILPTALIKVFNANGRICMCRALLDSASQASFITESCVQRLGLQKTNARLSVTGLGSSSAGHTKGKTMFTISSNRLPEIKIEAFILPKITTNLPSHSIDGIALQSKTEIQLADPHFHRSARIDVLIGADYFFSLLEPGQIKGNADGIILQNTVLGWIVSGCHYNAAETSLISMFTTHHNIDLDKTLRRFWELESVSATTPMLSPEESLCESHFNSNVKLDNNDRFIVGLPFKKSTDNLGNSLPCAIQRLRAMERRFVREPEFYALYRDFMSEYQALNHMREIPQSELNDIGHYLPHHGVLKHSSTTTKLRVVFDGSAKSTTGASLNDCLAIGPTVQRTLYSILLRFRERKFVITADVEKMYRQVKVDTKDTNYQKIVWRNHPSQPIRHYRLITVTYGLASSSFLATRVLKRIADDNEATNSRASNAIRNDFYVDDLMTGAESESEIIRLKESISGLLLRHGFNLRKWRSNSTTISIGEDDKLDNATNSMKSINDNFPEELPSSIKVLGLNWNPATDQFTFTSNLEGSNTLTKRLVVSEASRLFDPLGWLAPVVIVVKIFVQKLWAISLDWDEALPKDASDKWQQIRSQLEDVNLISIPRFLQINTKCIVDIHGFADASQNAYGAVVYKRITTAEGKISVQLISAKTKVSPIRQVSLPRLELCAAVMLTNLINLVMRETRTTINQVYAWTDSRIVLDWLSSHPKRWSTFVGNRTSEILATLTRKQWHHISSSDNPADCASRGLPPKELAHHQLWWRGPVWLHQSIEHWPSQQSDYGFVEEENKRAFTFATTIEITNLLDLLISRYSTITKLKSVLSYVLRYISNLRNKTKCTRGLTREELFYALFKLCKHEQCKFYPEEMKQLRVGKEIQRTSIIKTMNPFLDKFGVLRVGGRLEYADVSFSTKHPIILDPKSQLSRIIIHTIHIENKHAGPSLTLAISRQEYWIPRCRNLVRQIINTCVVCAKFKAQGRTQLMGNLPSSRVELIRPFLKVGVDYAGPILVHMRKGRGQRAFKSYISLFVCLSTKAIHLELVGDLTTEACLGALKRFVARRGLCQEIYSDNGTNFIGAERKLREEFNKLIKNSKLISAYFHRQCISWHFIPPAAPHFGGIWESGVKAAKYHLRRVIGNTILTYEEMGTLLAEIESILNSRPLCSISSTDIDVLTPSHFLIGHPATKIPEADITHLKPGHLTRWQMVQQLSQHFWRRWNNEYLTTLQPRSKWTQKQPPIKLGDIVAIRDNTSAVGQWPLGKVVRVHPGSDGLVRVVTIKTQSGEILRPIVKLCVLPVANDDNSSSQTTLHTDTNKTKQ